jgi:hypothetical protein
MIGELLLKSRYIRYPINKMLFRAFNHHRKLKVFRNKHLGETILIVGNGPSLNNTPLDKFKIPSIGMNKINLIYDRTTWRPSYILCNNGLVMNQNREYFKTTSIPVVLDYKAAFLNIRASNIRYFLPHFKDTFSEDFDENVGVSGTVTYTALQYAYYLGVKRIIIVGVDHNFKGYTNDKISSKIETFKGEDENHFDPNYFKGMKWGVPDMARSEIGYRRASEFLTKRNIEIYDATVNGKLNIFPKISIDEATEMIGS